MQNAILSLLQALGSFGARLLTEYPFLFGVCVLGAMFGTMAWGTRPKRVGR